MVDAQTITHYVEQNFAQFGTNKRNELARLLYEIAKREHKDFQDVLAPFPSSKRRFSDLKQYLLRRRFPHIVPAQLQRQRFPQLNIDPSNRVELKKNLEIAPNQFFIEESVKDTALAQRLWRKFPQAKFYYISSYKEHIRQCKFTLKDYNERLGTFYVIREEYDFYKPCPCSIKSVSCGYHVVNLGSGCAFECTYCYLQDYLNSPGIVLPANLEDFFEKFRRYKQDIRVGSGELTDSLLFDHITEYSPLIVEFFKQYPKSMFEFKTKSNNIQNLLKVKPAGNIVVSWSMNPQKIIGTTEFYTASLAQRIEAAIQCMRAGYKIAFHFDPMIYYPEWEQGYHDLIEQIFERIDPRCIVWISLGTLRMTPRLKKIIENRFVDNTILDEEFLLGYDGKFRYSFEVRTAMYKKIKEWLEKYLDGDLIYLCMEEKNACQTAALGPAKKKAVNLLRKVTP